MKQQLHVITLGVADFEQAVNFYEQGLGWQKSNQSMEGWALSPLGGMVLTLHPRDELAKDVGLSYQPSSFSGLTMAYNAESEQEVDVVLSKVKSLGGTIIKPAQE